jgi:hypothetical protein
MNAGQRRYARDGSALRLRRVRIGARFALVYEYAPPGAEKRVCTCTGCGRRGHNKRTCRYKEDWLG